MARSFWILTDTMSRRFATSPSATQGRRFSYRLRLGLVIATSNPSLEYKHKEGGVREVFIGPS